MKRWTWLAMVAATSACSFPTGEFSVGTAQPDVVTVDNGAVDTGATDVVSPMDQGATDVVSPGDVVTPDDVVTPGDVIDGGAPGDDVVPVSDAADAGDPDAGDPEDAPPVDAGCPSPQIACTVAGASACVNPLTSLDHCGRCNYACNPTNAAPVCTDGRCVLNCNAGFADCDGDPRNGCEGALNTIANCGTCANVCPAGAALNGTPLCTAGACTTTCNAGYANCNGMAADGCETPTANNAANCGMCGRACPAGQSCTAGACTAVCTSPNRLCSGVCTDVQTSASNCNACGNICPNPPNAAGACRMGACGIGTCNAGYGDCNAAVAGCETNVNTAVANCGVCGRACVFANATATCVAGVCTMGSCTGTFRDCDGNPANGCETDTSNTLTNCGACGTVCRTDARTSNSCVASRCAPVCNAGYADCDRSAANGCEASIGTDLNCGSCGAACRTGTTCGRGSCVTTSSSPTYTRSTGPGFFEVCSNALATRLLPSQDDASVLVPLPFNFTWWGTTFAAGAMVNVATNGFVSLHPAVFSTLQGIIPDPFAPDAVIAAWWTDLITSTQGVCTMTTGVAPNRRFYVQWGDVDFYSTRTGDMNFEIVLNEGSNIVDLVYSRVAAPPAGYVPTVGIESTNGNNAVVVCRSTDPSCTMVTNGTSIRFTPR